MLNNWIDERLAKGFKYWFIEGLSNMVDVCMMDEKVLSTVIFYENGIK